MKSTPEVHRPVKRRLASDRLTPATSRCLRLLTGILEMRRLDFSNWPPNRAQLSHSSYASWFGRL